MRDKCNNSWIQSFVTNKDKCKICHLHRTLKLDERVEGEKSANNIGECYSEFRRGRKNKILFFPFRIVRARETYSIFILLFYVKKLRKIPVNFFFFLLRSLIMEFLSLFLYLAKGFRWMIKMYGVLILTDFVEILIVVSI